MRLPLSNLIELSRSLRHYLGAGLTLRDVFRQQAQKGPPRVRPIAGRVRDALDQGDSLTAALEREKNAFPPLFLSMAGVGEESGNLPEIFHELEKYYLLQQKLKRQFISQITWPVLQLVMAIFVIAGMILILGIIGDSRGAEKPFDPLGLGTGEGAALRFLGVVTGGLALLTMLYFVATRSLRQKAAVDGFLLQLPVVGPCLRALALARFCLALHLTHETGMSVTRGLQLSLRATGNAAFENRTPDVVDGVRGGDDLTEALVKSRLFPVDFLNIVDVAEEGGRLTEVMQQQAEFYQEEAGRRMTILTQVASWGVWLTVAILIIICIFRIALTYISMLDPDNPVYK